MRVFEKYEIYEHDRNGNIKAFRKEAYTDELMNQSFELFQSKYDTHYGSIHIDENLISIHTGGWSENEALIADFKLTGWWFKHHKITANGGHYYFNTDFYAKKEWKIIKS